MNASKAFITEEYTESNFGFHWWKKTVVSDGKTHLRQSDCLILIETRCNWGNKMSCELLVDLLSSQP
jgi:hypothetical protein